MHQPTIPQAFESAMQHHQAGRLNEAGQAYRAILEREPNHPGALQYLGMIFFQNRKMDQAEEMLRESITQAPGYAEAHYNLGLVLMNVGRLDEAMSAYREAIALKPGLYEAHNNLGTALSGQGHLEQAAAAYRHVIALKPDYPVGHYNLGTVLRGLGKLEDATASLRTAIALNQDYADAHFNLGRCLKDQGWLEESVAAYRKALERKPDNAVAHSDLIYTLLALPSCDTGMIKREVGIWSQWHAEPLKQFIEPHLNDRSPDRRIRIGYVSPDFCQHVVGYNMLPLLTHHDGESFEVFCYSNAVRPDAITDRFRACANHWRDTTLVTDESLAALIREDQVDILVDLALHTNGNRLLTFARKPAPVQVTFAGYPGSTGLDAIDYRLTDPHLDPIGMDESVYSERTFRLPHSFWCYDPVDCRDVPSGGLPALENGFVTFGCLNNFSKTNDDVLRLWSGVLRAVPGSRLMVLSPEGEHRHHATRLFTSEGVDPHLLVFVPYQPRRKYMELYQRVDMVLDTFPYNGHSTSLDALWMGVPVVTLAGRTVVGRAGLSHLMNLNLPEFIAHTPEEYVRIATAWSADLVRLSELRASLRDRMEKSPLMDEAGFARNIEQAYRQMWRAWCGLRQ